MSNAILERHVSVLTVALGITACSLAIVGQVKTSVPAPVAGARPAIVERIKIHGTALEGNLEGDTHAAATVCENSPASDGFAIST